MTKRIFNLTAAFNSVDLMLGLWCLSLGGLKCKNETRNPKNNHNECFINLEFDLIFCKLGIDLTNKPGYALLYRFKNTPKHVKYFNVLVGLNDDKIKAGFFFICLSNIFTTSSFNKSNKIKVLKRGKVPNPRFVHLVFQYNFNSVPVKIGHRRRLILWV